MQGAVERHGVQATVTRRRAGMYGLRATGKGWRAMTKRLQRVARFRVAHVG